MTKTYRPFLLTLAVLLLAVLMHVLRCDSVQVSQLLSLVLLYVAGLGLGWLGDSLQLDS